MSERLSLSLEQLALYLAEKQSLMKEYKGVNYSHAIGITRSLLYFQDNESLHSRMRTYSSSLLDSLLKNKLLLQAPFISDRLTYVNMDLLNYFYRIYSKKGIEYKHPKAKAVQNFIKSEKETTRHAIIERFELRKEVVMEILTELRAHFLIFMHYNGQNWTVIDPEFLLKDETVSQASSIKELIYKTIQAFGPITVPQIMSILELSGGKVSTSLIELFENKRVIRGQFIETSSYESFIVSDEKEHLRTFLNQRKTTSNRNMELLPSTDTLIRYWSSSDFLPLEETKKVTVLHFGLPICSFDYQIFGNELHITNLRTSEFYSELEEEVFQIIQEFAENKGKIAVLPQLKVDRIKEQSIDFAQTLVKRGYRPRSSGLVYMFNNVVSSDEYNNLLSWQEIFPFLLRKQYLASSNHFHKKEQLLSGLSSLGVPLPLTSLFIRTSRDKNYYINELLVNKKLALSKFGSYYRGIINTTDFNLFSQLRGVKRLGVLEERVLKIINAKGKMTFNQMKDVLSLSNKVLLGSLSRLESAHEIIQTKTISGKVVWMPKNEFVGNTKIRKVNSSREAWLELLYKILDSNLPLSIRQIANLTGLSNTQIEIYLKELIASRGVRSGRYIDENKETQYTTESIETALNAYHYELENQESNIKKIGTTYLPRNDPLLILYSSYLIGRFQSRKLFTNSLPSEYGELILLNGTPMTVIHYRRNKNFEYIHNIEVLPEFNDNHHMMFIFSAIDNFRKQTKSKTKAPIHLKYVNNISLSSDLGKEISELIANMDLDLIPM